LIAGSPAVSGDAAACRLPIRGSGRHAQYVRHATEDDLDRVDALLAELRGFPQLRERKRGSFSYGSRAFLHFHEDAGDLYVDVRLDSAFERMKVTSDAEQADFLAAVRCALNSA
jgi:hypothetical protein